MKQECEECNGRGFFIVRIYEEGTEIDEVECENCKGAGTVDENHEQCLNPKKP